MSASMNELTGAVGPKPGPPSPVVNYGIAEKLRQAGDILGQQGSNPFRVAAYRRAADAVLREDRDLREIFESKGTEGVLAIPHVGRGIAAAIIEMLRTGHWSQLERLRGTLDPVRVFQTVPGIGPALAQRISDVLGIDTLEGLEIAAHDGRRARSVVTCCNGDPAASPRIERLALRLMPAHHTLALERPLGLCDDGVLRFLVGIVIRIDDDPIPGAA